MYLWKEKKYRVETLFLAINIFDRVLSHVVSQITPIKISLIVVSCMILAAKIEQPMTPSINRMIALLSERERKSVSKADVIYLEE